MQARIGDGYLLAEITIRESGLGLGLGLGSGSGFRFVLRWLYDLRPHVPNNCTKCFQRFFSSAIIRQN